MWPRLLWDCKKPLLDGARLENLLIESVNLVNADTVLGTDLVGLNGFIIDESDIVVSQPFVSQSEISKALSLELSG